MIIIIECIIACLLFTILIFFSSKNPIEGIYNYPPAIVEKVKELGLIKDIRIIRSKNIIIKKLCFAFLIVVICSIVFFFINGNRSFIDGFITSYLLWNVVDWYDAFIIDCLWFCLDKRFVIAGTEGMREYKDYWFHIKGSLKGMLIGLPVAILVGINVLVMSVLF